MMKCFLSIFMLLFFVSVSYSSDETIKNAFESFKPSTQSQPSVSKKNDTSYSSEENVDKKVKGSGQKRISPNTSITNENAPEQETPKRQQSLTNPAITSASGNSSRYCNVRWLVLIAHYKPRKWYSLNVVNRGFEPFISYTTERDIKEVRKIIALQKENIIDVFNKKGSKDGETYDLNTRDYDFPVLDEVCDEAFLNQKAADVEKYIKKTFDRIVDMFDSELPSSAQSEIRRYIENYSR